MTSMAFGAVHAPLPRRVVFLALSARGGGARRVQLALHAQAALAADLQLSLLRGRGHVLGASGSAIELQNVYFMRRSSVVCCVMQTVYLALFVVENILFGME